MAAVAEAKPIFQAFRQAFDASDDSTCQASLVKLKIAIASFASTSPVCPPSQLQKDELLIARETLELAAFLAVRQKDMSALERHVTQLKPYYYDFGKVLPPSERRLLTLGALLLFLLSSDRIAEFHTELELIPVEDHANHYINYAVVLERCVMEGAYSQIQVMKKDVPAESYGFFMDQLMDTVRQKIGLSLEKAYDKLPATEASRMLMLGSVSQLESYADKENERKQEERELALLDDGPASFTRTLSRATTGPMEEAGVIQWVLDGDTLHFKQDDKKRAEVPALELITNTIGYATELERIV
mmetsp:Transcript_111092/g.254712  ORF Transcript_111092/g.254712 Transcript_111092/m.254712 type:complete len:301 (-) Transcript_111092:170-1072(-)|eukprot:CAMPEP_0204270924 /NCGR_PEP_ID=MMETSP0468-20130131/19169_1 /ASSEMBLY_ACC=CAM_ASM_000383 /TAXON_ID=2969 /ORGANISM="Oxyrrhis marina" /LENGTH=300 /DNA_ID=CAMNT_0051246517 /DNA_START=45 /DNA_END=947 /DNA_ORIENTATION=+